MVGEVHEFVDQVRLVQVTRNRAQLLVGGETFPGAERAGLSTRV